MSKTVLKIKDENGNWVSVPSIRGGDGLTPFVGENGNWWLGTIDTGVRAKAIDGTRIEKGSYNGTNTYGVDAPVILNFDFAPKLLMVFCGRQEKQIPFLMIAINGIGKGVSFIKEDTSSDTASVLFNVNISFSDNRVSYYSNSAENQFNNTNYSAYVYHYFAIG